MFEHSESTKSVHIAGFSDWSPYAQNSADQLERGTLISRISIVNSPNPRPVLFYDGECGICDVTVRWFLKRDHRAVLMFSPLQGLTYAAISLPGKPADLGSVVLFDGRTFHVRSSAVLHALQAIGGIWKPLAILSLVIPVTLRDMGYNFVAQRRLRWFGGKESCQIPSVTDRSRFLP